MAAPYGMNADVAARIPRGAPAAGFTSTSTPTDTRVTTWIAEVSARVDGSIKRAGYDPLTLSATGTSILTEAVTEWVAGMVERYWGGFDAAGNDGGDRERLLRTLLTDLHTKPAEVGLMLGLTPPAGALTGTSIASYWTDDADATDDVITPDNTFKVSGQF